MKIFRSIVLFLIINSFLNAEISPQFNHSESGVNFVSIPEGSFRRNIKNVNKNYDHSIVNIDKFFMTKNEISWRNWMVVCGKKSAEILFKREFEREIHSKDLDYPVVGVNYFEILVFCRMLNNRLIEDKNIKGKVLLPTEAQWEYVAQSSNNAINGENVRGLDSTELEVWNVSQGTPNKFGIVNMLGNVSEFVRDVYSEKLLIGDNPKNTVVDDVINLKMVIHGGSYFMAPDNARSDYRFPVRPDFASRYTGFRVVWENNR